MFYKIRACEKSRSEKNYFVKQGCNGIQLVLNGIYVPEGDASVPLEEGSIRIISANACTDPKALQLNYNTRAVMISELRVFLIQDHLLQASHPIVVILLLLFIM